MLSASLNKTSLSLSLSLSLVTVYQDVLDTLLHLAADVLRRALADLWMCWFRILCFHTETTQELSVLNSTLVYILRNVIYIFATSTFVGYLWKYYLDLLTCVQIIQYDICTSGVPSLRRFQTIMIGLFPVWHESVDSTPFCFVMLFSFRIRKFFLVIHWTNDTVICFLMSVYKLSSPILTMIFE